MRGIVLLAKRGGIFKKDFTEIFAQINTNRVKNLVNSDIVIIRALSIT
jgi:hypothetical protein